MPPPNAVRLASMPLSKTCPQCLQMKGVYQEKASAVAHVDYYWCAECHYVWYVERTKKTATEQPPTIVRPN